MKEEINMDALLKAGKVAVVLKVGLANACLLTHLNIDLPRALVSHLNV